MSSTSTLAGGIDASSGSRGDGGPSTATGGMSSMLSQQLLRNGVCSSLTLLAPLLPSLIPSSSQSSSSLSSNGSVSSTTMGGSGNGGRRSLTPDSCSLLHRRPPKLHQLSPSIPSQSPSPQPSSEQTEEKRAPQHAQTHGHSLLLPLPVPPSPLTLTMQIVNIHRCKGYLRR